MMKIGTFRFRKITGGNWALGEGVRVLRARREKSMDWPDTICYQGLYAVIKHTLKETCYDVSFYNRKPRGPNFSVELMGRAWRRVGSKNWKLLNFNLGERLGHDCLGGAIVYFKIKPVKTKVKRDN